MVVKRGLHNRGMMIYEGFEILFAGMVVLLLFSFAYRAGTGIDFEKIYVAKDFALTLNTLYGVSGDVKLDYENPYALKFSEEINQGIIRVYSGSPEFGVAYQYVQSKSSVINAKFENPDYLSFSRQSGNVEVSQTRITSEKSACPDLNTQADIKKVKLIFDPGHSESDKGYSADSLEEYKLAKQIADSISILCKVKQYDCKILQQSGMSERINQIKDTVPNEAGLLAIISLHIRADSVRKDNMPLNIYVPSGYARSDKLSCIIMNKFAGKFDSSSTQKFDLKGLQENDPLLVLNPWKDLPDVFPSVEIEVGNIYNKGYLSDPNNINFISSSIIEGLEEYYK